jgi:uncharacterized repeat protein (TIGR03803 family)
MLTTLHTFSSTDGAYPAGPLFLGADGRLYGTTPVGGTPSGSSGTVFAITTGGTFTSLHSFSTVIGGFDPAGALVQAADGNLYGITTYGGTTCTGGNNGTIYYISPGGHTFVSIWDFGKYVCGQGAYPRTGLVLGSDSNFYAGVSGGIQNGGAGFDGILFEITPKLEPNLLYTFDYTTYWYNGGINLMQDTNGTFYGTATPLDSSTPPVVFSLSNGLGPFITTVPQMRGTGAKVLILGQGLTGSTSVTFNGVAAEFTVNSDTEITATVPAGATKGIVQVVTPSGTLSTTVLFYIG